MILEELATERQIVMLPVNEVGRAARCALRLDDHRVSALHASICWDTTTGWRVRDLGSRNHTFLDRERLADNDWHVLKKGAIRWFGGPEQAFRVLEDSSPRPYLVSGPDPMIVLGETLAVPDEEAPLATLFRGPNGSWQVELESGLIDLRDRDTFQVGGKTYQFFTPAGEASTPTSSTDAPATLSSCRTRFLVSRNEEHIELEIEVRPGPKVVRLESRAYWYLLLTLARQKLDDAADGLPEPSCGWTHQAALEDALKTTTARVNLDIFRIRKSFCDLSLQGAARVIERRARTGQLRIGLIHLTIDRE